MIKFVINGRTVNPRNVGDALMRAMMEGIAAQIREKIGAIRDPETGEFPTIVVRGDSLDNLTVSADFIPLLPPDSIILVSCRFVGGTTP